MWRPSACESHPARSNRTPVVTPYDGEKLAIDSKELTIASPPQAPSIEIQPSAPLSEEDLTCSVVAPSSAMETASSTSNGKRRTADASPSPSYPHLQTDEIWTCEVTPADGTMRGQWPWSPKPSERELDRDAIHAIGGNTCIIRRLPQRNSMLGRRKTLSSGDFTDFIRSSSQMCARSRPRSLVAPARAPQARLHLSPLRPPSIQIGGASRLSTVVNGFCHWDDSGTLLISNARTTTGLLIGGNVFQQVVSGSDFVCGLRTTV